MRTGTRISLIVTILMLIACALVASQMSSAATQESPILDRARVLEQQSTPRGDPAAPPDRADEGIGAVDLFGNEVSDAVAKYKTDGAGGLYELHSPQTEVPRLGSPKS